VENVTRKRGGGCLLVQNGVAKTTMHEGSGGIRQTHGGVTSQKEKRGALAPQKTGETVTPVRRQKKPVARKNGGSCERAGDFP